MYGRLLPLFFLFAIACGGGDLSVDEESAGEESTNNASTGTEMDDDESSMETPTTDESSTNNDETSPATNNSTSSNTNNETISTTNNNLPGDTNNMPAETNNEPQFDPMFVAVADFMREKCISCHAQGQNGNFQIPSATSTNQEVRDALEGVQATSGRLLVEPGDPAESQVYIMITNDAGEQFEPETIAIVEDWILANTPYTL